MANYEKFKGQYISKYDLLLALWEQQKYGSVQDSKGRAKAILTIIDMPPIDIKKIIGEETNNELHGQ